jgi:hypothetical protein
MPDSEGMPPVSPALAQPALTQYCHVSAIDFAYYFDNDGETNEVHEKTDQLQTSPPAVVGYLLSHLWVMALP